MKTKHLSDDDIQRYVFDPIECKTDAIEHISSCSLCKKRMESYVILLSSIQKLPEPQVEFDLSNRVLTQIETTKDKRNILNYFNYFLIAVGLIVLVSCLWYISEELINLSDSYSGVSIALVASVALLIFVGITVDMLIGHNKKINRMKYQMNLQHL